MAFGDLFLPDVRAYRERLLDGSGIVPVFPLWGRPTPSVARAFVRDGFRAVLVCVDPRQLDVSHCGAEFDDSLIAALPGTVDPCGENGEFHTFVYDGPMFGCPIGVQRGEVVEKSGFAFCDLLPGDAACATSGDAPRGGIPRA
jgi:diphthamide synthase (EF-2-diphthine--ammonia ligase)